MTDVERLDTALAKQRTHIQKSCATRSQLRNEQKSDVETRKLGIGGARTVALREGNAGGVALAP
jgi:hypothetical protein